MEYIERKDIMLISTCKRTKRKRKKQKNKNKNEMILAAKGHYGTIRTVGTELNGKNMKNVIRICERGKRGKDIKYAMDH